MTAGEEIPPRYITVGIATNRIDFS